MNSNKFEFELESSGNVGLDSILGGGIPSRSLLVVAGEPGSGKTIFSLQMLFNAARQKKRALYFTTLSEPAIKVIRYMQMFDFFDLDLLYKQVVFVDLSTHLREGPERTLQEIAARVEEQEPHIVAIDSFRAVGEQLRAQPVSCRPFIYDLAVQMVGWGATALLVGEYEREEFSSFAEFAVADGILHLSSQRQELTSVREMEILKLRGAVYASGRHFFDINRSGVCFYPRVSTPSDTQTQPRPDGSSRALTGIDGLDDLFQGGIPRGSATIVQGATGAGKTLLSLQFLIEGARRGEKGVLFTLEETPEQLRSNARSLGWNLESLEAEGRLIIKYTSPVELSTDRFLYDSANEVRELGVRRAVFDSLTTMALGIPSARRYKEMVYAIAKHLRGEGVSLVMTVESEQLLGAANLTGHGVSFIADNLIQLRYVEIGAKLERAISVLKARGIKHDSELRSLRIGDNGLHVIKERFKDMRGVLTGLPSRSRESE